MKVIFGNDSIFIHFGVALEFSFSKVKFNKNSYI